MRNSKSPRSLPRFCMLSNHDYHNAGFAVGIPRPPEIRDKLLDLHQRAMDLFNSGYRRSTDRGVFDLALEIEDEIFEAMEDLETIRDTLSDLTVLTPDEDEVEEGENEDD